MKIKVSEATNTQLDWAVAKALGRNPLVNDKNSFFIFGTKGEWFSPSTDWAQGGPIIEREGIELHGSILDAGNCWAQFYRPHTTFDGGARHYHRQEGPTPLIAAMRCFICSRFGAIVEVPDELLESF